MTRPDHNSNRLKAIMRGSDIIQDQKPKKKRKRKNERSGREASSDFLSKRRNSTENRIKMQLGLFCKNIYW